MDAEPVHGGTVKKRKTPGKPGVMPNRVRLSGDFSPGQLATVATESLEGKVEFCLWQDCHKQVSTQKPATKPPPPWAFHPAT
jgi:hypothetical protein